MPRVVELDVPAMHAMYERGYSLKEVGRAFSCGWQTVRRRFVAAGYRIRGIGERGDTLAVRREMRRLYEVEGWTMAEIAVLYDCTAGNVWDRLRLAGTRMRKSTERVCKACRGVRTHVEFAYSRPTQTFSRVCRDCAAGGAS